MSRLRVAPIVEGDGEVECIRDLLDRIWRNIIDGDYVDVVKPTRTSRTMLAQRLKSGELRISSDEVAKVVRKALNKLQEKRMVDLVYPELVLLLIDADEDCPAELGPKLLRIARETVGDRSDRINVACVVANLEYETWFVASAESLKRYLDLPDDFQPIENPETQKAGKRWIETRRERYKETQDQPAMTAKMDLSLCRRRSPSFNKLCRELEKLKSASTGVIGEE